jgi:predicted nucleic acid-binding protein
LNGVLVDSCVLLDLVTDDPNWAEWSEATLEKYSLTNSLFINSIVYTELSMGFEKVEELEAAIDLLNLKVIEMPREALFLTGKVYLRYRKNKGTKISPLPDFFIVAHASVSQLNLITRDVNRYRTYFPNISLIYPEH